MTDPESTTGGAINVGRRLREFYLAKGVKRKEFAEMMDIPYERLRSYERGRAEPNSVFFLKLSSIYPDVDVAWILMGREPRDGNLVSTPELGESDQAGNVPILQHIRGGKFIGDFLDEDIIGWVNTQNRKDKDLFAMKVEGNSMFPEIQDGDVVIFAPHRPFVSGMIYAVWVDGEKVTLKRVYRRGTEYELVATSPEFPTQVLPDLRVTKLIRAIEVQRGE